MQVGSSPRMRGAQVQSAKVVGPLRIIPAYAGSTDVAHTLVSSGTDHPRVCGEHFNRSAMKYGNTGSSPRMRGAHDLGLNAIADIGIIPAYAGSTR